MEEYIASQAQELEDAEDVNDDMQDVHLDNLHAITDKWPRRRLETEMSRATIIN